MINKNNKKSLKKLSNHFNKTLYEKVRMKRAYAVNRIIVN